MRSQGLPTTPPTLQCPDGRYASLLCCVYPAHSSVRLFLCHSLDPPNSTSASQPHSGLSKALYQCGAQCCGCLRTASMACVAGPGDTSTLCFLSREIHERVFVACGLGSTEIFASIYRRDSICVSATKCATSCCCKNTITVRSKVILT